MPDLMCCCPGVVYAVGVPKLSSKGKDCIMSIILQDQEFEGTSQRDHVGEPWRETTDRAANTCVVLLVCLPVS